VRCDSPSEWRSSATRWPETIKPCIRITAVGECRFIPTPHDVILKASQRLKNLPFNVDEPNNIRSPATSLEDPSHSLDAPPQDDISDSIQSTVPKPGWGRRARRYVLCPNRFEQSQNLFDHNFGLLNMDIVTRAFGNSMSRVG
jgi:hypothetical protein